MDDLFFDHQSYQDVVDGVAPNLNFRQYVTSARIIFLLQ